MVKVGSDALKGMKLSTGVPQGSVLSPRSFVYYAEDVQEIFKREELTYHLFANDMQGHRRSQPQDAASIVASLQDYHCGFRMVCIETSSTERQEDGSPVVWIGSGAPQGGRSRQTSYYWHRCHPTSRRGPGSRSLL